MSSDFEDGLTNYLNSLENQSKEKDKLFTQQTSTSETKEVEGLDLIEEEGESIFFELTKEELEENSETLLLDKYLVQKNEYDEIKDENDLKKDIGDVFGDENQSDVLSEEHIDIKDLLGSDNESEKNKDEEEDDTDGILDVNDPSLYSSDNDSVSFEDLNGNSTHEEDEAFDFPSKQKYDDVVGRKKKFEPGKLNKNNLLIAICGFMGIVLLGFMWATRKQEEKKKDKNNTDDTVFISDYTPEFGNYKDRAYKPPIEESNVSQEEDDAIEKINQIVEDASTKGKYENPNQKKQEVQINSQSYVQPVTVQSDDYAKRVSSSLRKNISGENNVSYLPVANNGYDSYNTSFLPQGGSSTDGYFNQLGQITNALKSNVSENNAVKNNNFLRFSDAGRYDKDIAGGDSQSLQANSIYPGTIIPAVLVNGINTDYPGTITARVTSNVYDSRTGTKLLIPQGSILRGSYSSSSIGIKRIQIAWQTIVINRDGRDYIVNLGSMVGVDSKGYSGIGGSLNDHYFSYLKAAGLSVLFTYINNSVYSVTQSQKNKVTAEMISQGQEIGNKLTDKLLDRALEINPTVTVKGGTKIYVDVDKVLTLQPYERDIPVQRYKR